MSCAKRLLATVLLMLVIGWTSASATSRQWDASPENTTLAGDAQWRSDARFGKVLELGKNGTAVLSLEKSMQGDTGSISFWVKPNWESNSTRSHTLLSARWNDERKSYLAISEGWWEPTGAHRLYFVMSNEDIRHCSTERRLPPGMWSLLTAVWSTDGSVCKLFIDDELVAETHGEAVAHHLSFNKILVGTDAASTDSRSRFGNASIAHLAITRRSTSHREIIERYSREEPPVQIDKKKWQWLEQSKEESNNATRSAPSLSKVQRAIFDEDIAWAVSKDNIDKRLERIARAGFDIYVPCVWHGTGAWYPTKVGKIDPRLQRSFSSNWDPLAYLIEQAHYRGIEVHPWFTVVRRENDDHPEWAEVGVPPGAYDVHRPEFRKYIVDVMLDLVDRYGVDGVNLDYIRSMGVCLSKFCKLQYRNDFGVDLADDATQSAGDEAARDRLQRWQDGAVEDIVKRFTSRARKLKESLIVSVDGHASYNDTKRPMEGRNEIRWLNEGLIDGVFHMDYKWRFDQSEFLEAKRTLKAPEKLWLLISNYDLVDGLPMPRSSRWLNGVMRYVARTEQSAVGVYLFGQLSDEQVAGLSTLRHGSSVSGVSARD